MAQFLYLQNEDNVIHLTEFPRELNEFVNIWFHKLGSSMPV